MKRVALALGLALVALACSGIRAQETAVPVLESALLADAEVVPSALRVSPDFWEVRFMAYGWLPSMSGRAGVGNNVGNTHITMRDVLDNLDLFDAVYMADLEVRAGRWGMISDLFFYKVSGVAVSAGPPPSRARLVAEQTLLDLAPYYRVGTWSLGNGPGNTLSVDLLGGARYNRLKGNVGLTIDANSISVGGTRDWWDPIVGTRATWNIDPKLSLSVRGDIGGFGLEHCSDSTWQLIGNVNYNFTRHFFATAGYRTVSIDYVTGQGASRFTYDMRIAGPYLGLGLRF